jgi:recombination protein RecT
MTTETRDTVADIRHNLGLMKDQFKACFPSQHHVDRFIRVVMTAVQQNADLTAPNLRTSFYSACMRCAQDGLMPDGREAALVIYGGQNPGVQYQPMIEGLMKKLRNSGEIVGAPKVHVWKEHDTFDYHLGDDERISHKPLIGERGMTMGAYSIVTLKSGGISREVMSIAEIKAIQARSRSPNKGPWQTDFDEMCRKTVFRRHYKKLPKSTDLDNVLKADDETFVPYENGTGVVAQPQAKQGSTAAEPAQRRPAALAAVASAGGTPMPEQAAPEKREPATQAPASAQQPAGQNDGPRDIL